MFLINSLKQFLGGAVLTGKSLEQWHISHKTLKQSVGGAVLTGKSLIKVFNYKDHRGSRCPAHAGDKEKTRLANRTDLTMGSQPGTTDVVICRGAK